MAALMVESLGLKTVETTDTLRVAEMEFVRDVKKVDRMVLKKAGKTADARVVMTVA